MAFLCLRAWEKPCEVNQSDLLWDLISEACSCRYVHRLLASRKALCPEGSAVMTQTLLMHCVYLSKVWSDGTAEIAGDRSTKQTLIKCCSFTGSQKKFQSGQGSHRNRTAIIICDTTQLPWTKCCCLQRSSKSNCVTGQIHISELPLERPDRVQNGRADSPTPARQQNYVGFYTRPERCRLLRWGRRIYPNTSMCKPSQLTSLAAYSCVSLGNNFTRTDCHFLLYMQFYILQVYLTWNISPFCMRLEQKWSHYILIIAKSEERNLHLKYSF